MERQNDDFGPDEQSSESGDRVINEPKSQRLFTGLAESEIGQRIRNAVVGLTLLTGAVEMTQNSVETAQAAMPDSNEKAEAIVPVVDLYGKPINIPKLYRGLVNGKATYEWANKEEYQAHAEKIITRQKEAQEKAARAPAEEAAFREMMRRAVISGGGAPSSVSPPLQPIEVAPVENANPKVERLPNDTWRLEAAPVQKNGEGMRGPLKYGAQRWVPMPVEQSEGLTGIAEDSKVRIEMTVIPPADIGDYMRQRSDIHVDVTGVKSPLIHIERVVTQEGNVVLNIYVSGATKRGDRVTVIPRITSWVSVPDAPKLPIEAVNDIDVQAAMAAVQNVKPVNGGCYVNSLAIQDMLNPPNQHNTVLIVGYLPEVSEHGGTPWHAYNLNPTKAVIIDSNVPFVGGGNPRHIPCLVGEELTFGRGGRQMILNLADPSKNKKGGTYTTSGLDNETKIIMPYVVSVPGVGPNGAKLQLVQPPAEVLDDHRKFVDERLEINKKAQGPNPADIGGAR